MKDNLKKCVLCNDYYYGHGYDAVPLAEGNCCEKCNESVKAERLERLYSDHEMQELLKKYNAGEFEDTQQ